MFAPGVNLSHSATGGQLSDEQRHLDDFGALGTCRAPGIFAATAFHAVLHGHTKFSVIMSMYCMEENCIVYGHGIFSAGKDGCCGRPVQRSGILTF